MSISSWNRSYYTSVKNSSKWTDKKCFQRTLRKYKGFRKENQNKHQVKIYLLAMDGSSSCSLCLKYFGTNPNLKDCEPCPLFQAGLECNKPNSPWRRLQDSDNPEPMIKQMETMIEQCNRNGKWIKPKEN